VAFNAITTTVYEMQIGLSAGMNMSYTQMLLSIDNLTSPYSHVKGKDEVKIQMFFRTTKFIISR
jgi:hypothetical protein